MRFVAQPVIVRDTREQRPYDFPQWSTVDRGLKFGDYAIAGLEHVVAVERKNFEDFVNTVTVHHDRFSEEVRRAQDAGARLVVVVEGELRWVVEGRYRSTVLPQCILGAVAALQIEGVPVLFAGDREGGRDMTERILLRAWELARRAWRETQRKREGAVPSLVADSA